LSDAPNPGDVARALRELSRLVPLAELVKRAALGAAAARRSEFASQHADGRSLPPLPEGLSRADTETPFGNVLAVLERGVTTPAEGALIGTLLALSATEEPASEADEAGFVAHLTWLAAHTPCDALLAFDACLGERDVVWRTLGRIATEPDRVAGDFGRVEALIAAATLSTSTTASAARARAGALLQTEDPTVRALLGAGGASREALAGEIAPSPLGPLLTAVLSVTLVLFAWQLARLVGRLAFAYRRPASFRLTERGLELTHHVELLGRVLGERSTLIPLSSIVRVTREVKYARAGLYAGIASLCLGTYFGTGLFVDGMRVPGGSVPLLGLAVAFILAGLLLDFVLTGAEDNLRGRCRLLVVPARGRTLCLGRVDPERADEMLAFVTEVARSQSTPPPAPA